MLQENPQVFSKHHSQLTCPHCGYNTIVQHGNVYTCLNCNFRRNVSEPDESIGLAAILTLAAIVFAIWLSVLGDPPNQQPTNASGIESQTTLSTPLG